MPVLKTVDHLITELPKMGLPLAELVRLCRNGVTASFLDETAKSTLLSEIDTVASEYAQVVEF